MFNIFHIHQKKTYLIFIVNDIFVMPSVTELLLVYAEAMSQGLPVIYTRGQGFDGQFEEEKLAIRLIARIREISMKIIDIINNLMLFREIQLI